MILEKGDQIFVTRHGTDHSYTECYFIIGFLEDGNYIQLSDKEDGEYKAYCRPSQIDNKEIFLHKKRKPFKLDERLFEL